MDGKTISQFWDAIEPRLDDREQRGSRTLCRMSAVIEAMNEICRGPGLPPIRSRTISEDHQPVRPVNTERAEPSGQCDLIQPPLHHLPCRVRQREANKPGRTCGRAVCLRVRPMRMPGQAGGSRAWAHPELQFIFPYGNMNSVPAEDP
ncbi:hypothetical protein DP939_45190 [Spongiactinospora rosea]|uniref:Uncharacterized protein n=1 Tax=Spongiactinospora rosea TaxID=2248750 RepID=A0A366LCI4_9ACTN|nr:hypothetical protein DP939_45190 [Spongiactinospora rosea]